MKTKYYQNIECGNIFDYNFKGFAEMCKEAAEMYDYGDPTNDTPLEDYYTVIEI